jgi:flagellar biosynthesis GTPase FlhF
MELKRILANDTKSATERAMALYGRNVLVISNHTVGGQTELVVALDIDEQSLDSTVSPAHQAAPAFAAPAAPAAFAKHFVQAQAQAPGKAAGKVPGNELQTTAKALALSKADDERDYLRSREIMDLIRDELASLRREISLSQKTTGWQASLNLSAEVEDLMASFTQAGMPTGLRTLLLDTVKDMRSEHEALSAVRNQLEDIARRPSVALPQTGVHLIAGPSGSGKTMMVMRLASEAAAQMGADKVAIVSYQDERVGAWAHTQALAAQSGVDCFRADTPAALVAVLNRLSERGLVLIDSSGSQMAQRITEVQTACPACETHAVVSADASSATLRRVLRTSGIRWNSLMVSKLDESVQPWPLVEFLCDNFLSLSAASDGAHVHALKRDLSTSALVEMAVAQLSRVPESIAPIQVAKPMPIKLQPPTPRLSAPASPRGLRGPFN